MAVDPVVFGLSSHPLFAKRLTSALEAREAEVKLGRFPDGEGFVEIGEEVRGATALIVQSVVRKPSYYLMELLMAADALRRAGAAKVVAVMPYFGYARQDKRQGKSGLKCEPITARLVADMLERAGVDEVLTMDLHTAQIEGFFRIPLQDLSAQELLAKEFGKRFKPDLVISPDVGSIRIAKAYARFFGVDFATVDKQRLSPDDVKVHAVIGNVRGLNLLFVDDLVSTGKTLAAAVRACREAGALSLVAAATHGLFVNEAVAELESSPLEALFIADTVPVCEGALKWQKIHEVSVAGLFADAIRRM